MRFDQLSRNRPGLDPPLSSGRAAGQPQPHVSRRRFLQRTAGAAAIGAATGAGFLGLGRANAAAPGIGLVVPIPYGLDFFGDGRVFHVEAPPFPNSGEDPATVYNFEGTSGISFTDGLVDRTNRKTGLVETLPFIANDMRFMQGQFRGRDGHVRAGTFGFVWIDVYDPGSGSQLHDFNPGIAQSGLFWTSPVSASDVHADLLAGTAAFAMQDAPMNDYLTFDNAVNGGGPPPRPGSVSFRVTWVTTGSATITDVPSKKFHGEHAPAEARMEWTGRSGDYDFQSQPSETSSSPFGALLGRERNGSFY